METKKKIDGLEIELVKKVGGNGKLFGTVTSSELLKELKGREIDVEKRLISIETPIKSTGTFNIKVKIFQDIVGEFQVTVKMSAQQLEELKKKSRTVSKKKKTEENEVPKDDETDSKAEIKTEAKVTTEEKL